MILARVTLLLTRILFLQAFANLSNIVGIFSKIVVGSLPEVAPGQTDA